MEKKQQLARDHYDHNEPNLACVYVTSPTAGKGQEPREKIGTVKRLGHC